MSLIETRNSPYTDEDIERGLTALAMAGDNSLRAAEASAFPSSTLRAWRQRHAERYEEIRTQRAPEIDRLIVAEQRQVAVQAAQATLQAIELGRQQLAEGKVKDAAAAARNFATTTAIAIDKTALMEGRPTQRIERVTTDEALAWAEAQGWITHINTTAEDITTKGALGTGGHDKRAS